MNRLRYEEPDVIKLREMLECYIDACNHKILFNPDDFAAGVRVLQRRIELIPDVDSLSIIVDGLPEAWAEKKNLQNKKDELEILIMYTNLRRITLSDENK
ncbi:MAG: hypothetical protein B6244_11060 [Candidatus Cloacimonetes bacterium 4572_55]|nr:MAG: hypothetical protein B6244_11060 [Candidatus Cloacimonetes bacterium 4572_55]